MTREGGLGKFSYETIFLFLYPGKNHGLSVKSVKCMSYYWTSFCFDQPQEIGIVGHQTDEENLAPLTERVSLEMYDGIIREVVEETGVPASSLVSTDLQCMPFCVI